MQNYTEIDTDKKVGTIFTTQKFNWTLLSCKKKHSSVFFAGSFAIWSYKPCQLVIAFDYTCIWSNGSLY